MAALLCNCDTTAAVGEWCAALGSYDHGQPLVIDPVLVYASVLPAQGLMGGAGTEGVAVDAAGDAYVAGMTSSYSFPTLNPVQGTYHGGLGDAFAAKLNPSGTALLYSTYLGGAALDQATSLAVDGGGNAYLAGTTTSTDFPTMNPYQPANHGTSNSRVGGDAFLSKINADGSALLFSTYLGGSGPDWGYAIAVDGSGSAYLGGQDKDTNFPIANPLPGTGAG